MPLKGRNPGHSPAENQRMDVMRAFVGIDHFQIDEVANNTAESRIKCNTSTLIGVVMTKHFEQLSAEERATIMVMAQEGQSLRAMARTLHRAPRRSAGNGAAMPGRPLPRGAAATTPSGLARKLGAVVSNRGGRPSWR